MLKKYFSLIFTLIIVSGFQLQAQNPEVFEVPSDDFPNLASVVSHINTNGPGDHGLIFQVAGDTSFPENNLVITGSGTAAAPIVIQWNGQGQKPQVLFSGTTSEGEAGFTFLGASHITIDGLDIQNADGLLDFGILMTNSSATQGSSYNTIRNTSITLNKNNPNETNGVRVINGITTTAASGSNSHNHFINNHISNVLIGYHFNSGTGNIELMDVGNVVKQEDDGQHIIEDIVMCGVFLWNQNGITLDGLHIRNLERPDDGTATAPAAIATRSDLPSGALDNPIVISNNHIYNLYSESTTIFGMYLNHRNAVHKVHGNRLYNIETSGTGNSIYASGIFVFATGLQAHLYNNMISAVSAPLSGLTSLAASRGIDLRTFSDARVFYNSVLIEYTMTQNNQRSAALNIHNTSDPVDLRNNIFVNNSQLALGTTGIIAAMHKANNNLNNIAHTSDRNIYYAGTPSASHLIFYGHHSSAPAVDQTLESYKLRAENFDQNSFTGEVPFFSQDDLHVDVLIPSAVGGNAQPIIEPFAVATDINGKNRHLQTPDIGAHELPLAMPDIAQNPYPLHEAEEVDPQTIYLQWQYFSSLDYVDPAGFLLYFGASADLTEAHYIGWTPFEAAINQYTYDFNDIQLEYLTQYFWKVVPSTHPEEGIEAQNVQIWIFTTQAFVSEYPNLATDPVPANGADNVLVNLAQLSWHYLPDPGFTQATGFEVYFGDTENLQAEDFKAWIDFVQDQEEYTFNLGDIALAYNATYYWKVVPAVSETEGPWAQEVPVWSFNVEDNVAAPMVDFNPVNIYPNPARTHLVIRHDGEFRAELSGIDGTLYISSSGDGMIQIDNLAELAAGIYIVRIISGNHSMSRIIQIMR